MKNGRRYNFIMRAVALTAAVLFAVVLVFSGVFVAQQKGHVCENEHCQVCYQVQVCEAIVKTATVAVGVFLLCKGMFFLAALSCSIAREAVGVYNLISLKVKLSN